MSGLRRSSPVGDCSELKSKVLKHPSRLRQFAAMLSSQVFTSSRLMTLTACVKILAKGLYRRIEVRAALGQKSGLSLHL